MTSLLFLLSSLVWADEVKMKELGKGRFQIGSVIVDQKSRSITIPAQVNMKKGAVEYLLVGPKSKTHEAVFLTEAHPFHVHLAALLLGLGKEGEPSKAVKIEVHWQTNGPDQRIPLEQTVVLLAPHAGETLQPKWTYGPKAENANRLTMSPFISIIHDPQSLMQYAGKSQGNDEIHRPNTKKLPKVGHPVKVVVTVK